VRALPDTDKYGNGERVLDVLQLLKEVSNPVANHTCNTVGPSTPNVCCFLSLLLLQCEDLDEDFIEDDADDLPVWEHEHRVKALPFTGAAAGQQQQQLLYLHGHNSSFSSMRISHLARACSCSLNILLLPLLLLPLLPPLLPLPLLPQRRSCVSGSCSWQACSSAAQSCSAKSPPTYCQIP
jgi:hypothetical protein